MEFPRHQSPLRRNSTCSPAPVSWCDLLLACYSLLNIALLELTKRVLLTSSLVHIHYLTRWELTFRAGSLGLLEGISIVFIHWTTCDIRHEVCNVK